MCLLPKPNPLWRDHEDQSDPYRPRRGRRDGPGAECLLRRRREQTRREHSGGFDHPRCQQKHPVPRERGHRQQRGGDANTTASSDGSGNKSGSKDKGDSDDKPCVGNPNVSSSNGVVTLSGHCDTINITGSGNQVTFESADKVILSGGNNSVTGQKLDDVEITSSGNSVTVADDLDEVTVSGSGNTVSSQGVEKKKDTGSGNTIS